MYKIKAINSPKLTLSPETTAKPPHQISKPIETADKTSTTGKNIE